MIMYPVKNLMSQKNEYKDKQVWEQTKTLLCKI